jgi:hypothetical protein
MFSLMTNWTLESVVTLAIALAGLILSLVSLWLQLSQTFVVVRLIPKVAVFTPGRDSIVTCVIGNKNILRLRKFLDANSYGATPRPGLEHPVEITVSADVINLSVFPITVRETGFCVEKFQKFVEPREKPHVFIPYLEDGGPWPRRLEPRENVELCCSHFLHGIDDILLSKKLNKLYIQTACEKYCYADIEPLLEALREIRSASSKAKEHAKENG